MIDITITTKTPYKTIKYLNRLNINIYNINYNKNSITLKISRKDLNKLGKYYRYKINKIYGKQELTTYLKNNYLNITYTIIIIILIFLITRITISIEVITENTYLRNHILNELDKNNITKYSIIKNNKEIKTIKDNILYNNKDLLEWINIERIGMKYQVNITPKVDKNKLDTKSYCNIISTKDSIITKVITHKGVELISPNDRVNIGDILISGDITYNNELKKQVCASGTVYGTTWYTVNISIPLTYEKTIKQDNTKYNILFKYNNKKKKLFKPKYTKYIEENTKIINIFGLEIYLQKEIKVKKEILSYTEEELNNLIEEKLNETLSHTLEGQYSIKTQKTLKKQVNNSTIELEIFIVAEEQISTITYE